MAVVVAPDRASELTRVFESHGERVFAIGRVVSDAGKGPRVGISGVEAEWRS
jgi:phosphoribosylaminoimidazole (AIR) synthetase